MRISYNWLHELVDFEDDPHSLAARLTHIGTAVDGIEPVAGNLENIVVGKIIEVSPHPRREKLTVCRVEVGKDIQMTVVCGAPNASVGMKSALALPGAELAGGVKVRSMEIEGVLSEVSSAVRRSWASPTTIRVSSRLISPSKPAPI